MASGLVQRQIFAVDLNLQIRNQRSGRFALSILRSSHAHICNICKRALNKAFFRMQRKHLSELVFAILITEIEPQIRNIRLKRGGIPEFQRVGGAAFVDHVHIHFDHAEKLRALFLARKFLWFLEVVRHDKGRHIILPVKRGFLAGILSLAGADALDLRISSLN